MNDEEGVRFQPRSPRAAGADSAGKTRITIRFDGDVRDWFRDQVDAAGGGNYQSMINAALREHITRSSEPLEDTLRRIVREELDRSA